MEQVFLGGYIRQRRKNLGLTQLQVCEGICEPMTLSRLENGHHSPSQFRICAILERLGLPDNRHLTLLSKKEVEINKLQKDIRADEISFRRAEPVNRSDIRRQALKKLSELERTIDADDNLTRQYILGARVSFGKPDGPYSFEERLDMLMQAIRLTVPRFELENIGGFRYSMDETKLINQIALTYSDNGHRAKALEIFGQLLAYVEQEDKDLPRYAGNFCLIAHNYAIALTLEKRFDEAAALAEKGKQFCVQYGEFQFLPGFLATLAECCYFTGNHQKSTEMYYMAYGLYKMLGDERNLSIMRSEMKERLNLTIPF